MKKMYSIFLILLLIFPLIFITLPPTQVNAIGENWLSGWANRKYHNITGSVGAGTDYQTLIKVYYGSGVDSGNTVYCGSKCQIDFDDLRFTEDDGNTLLDYWIETKVDSSYCDVWVEVADNLDSDQQIYMYYENSVVGNLSNAENTFLFFDHFEGTSLDPLKWTNSTEGNGYITVANSIVTVAHGTSGTGSARIDSINTFGINTSWRSSSSFSPIKQYSWRYLGYLGTGSGYALWYSASNTYRCYSQYVSTQYTNTINFMTDTFDPFEVRRENALINEFWWKDIFRVSHSSYISPDNLTLITWASETTASGGQYVKHDWVAVRKCIAVPPANDSWGNEESDLITITFYNQSNSVFMTNSIKRLNGSSVVYPNVSTIELQGIINASYSFDEFDWSYGSIEVNPYNQTFIANTTIWLNVAVCGNGIEPIIPVFPLSYAILILNFAVIGIGLSGFYYPILSWVSFILSLVLFVPMPTEEPFLRNLTVGTLSLSVIMLLINIYKRFTE